MKKSQVKINGILIALFFVLFNYQNCAPVAGTEGLQEDPSAQVGIIDQINVGQIDFMQEKVDVSSNDNDLSVFGVCSTEQSGSIIGWKIYDSEEQELFDGRSICDLGSFEIALEGLNSIACGERFELRASLGAKAKSQILIEKVCPN